MTGIEILLGGEKVALAERPLKNGGQAQVYQIMGDDGSVVKIYHDPPGEVQERRLRSMLTMAPLRDRLTHPSQPSELAWPTALARDPGGVLRGYAMPKFSEPGHVQLVALFTRAGRLRLFPERADWRFLLGVGWNLAFMTVRMHAEDLVIGDFSSNNVVVDRDGFITFLDCDSIDFTDPGTREHFPCLMQTAEYCAPERQQGGPASTAGDDFALAVLIYQLLTGGNHPFGGVPHDSHSEATIKDNISASCSYIVRPELVTVPRGVIVPSVLPPALLDLARAAFGPGAADPAARPTARDWFLALDQERSRVRVCTAWPRHTYGSHLTACPWCARAAVTHNDLFNATPPPVSVPAARRTGEPRVPQPQAASQAPAPQPVSRTGLVVVLVTTALLVALILLVAGLS